MTNGRVEISKLQAASIDPTRLIGDQTADTEGSRYMLVDGMPIKRHAHFETWLGNADKFVLLRKSAQRKLNYNRKSITLKNLIGYLKEIPIN